MRRWPEMKRGIASKGKFDIKLSTGHPKNGKYYARVKKKTFDNGQKICLSVNSGYIKIS
jgi:hypothetical protein